MLTHGGAGGIQDGLSLGTVHDDLLQPLQALLAQLPPVPDELGHPAVHGVLRDNLDELREVVPIPLAVGTVMGTVTDTGMGMGTVTDTETGR